MTKDEQARVTLIMSLELEDYEMLKKITQEEGKSLSEYLKTVLAIQAYISAKQKDGAIFLLEMPVRKWGIKRQETREIVFR